LFDAYRQFYRASPEADGVRAFLGERLARGDSTILVAVEEGGAVGFVQLYPLFASVAMQPALILNDLFVVPEARRTGVGARLVKAAERFAQGSGVTGMRLSTQVSNSPAQSLYEHLGWQADREFRSYNRVLAPMEGMN
jgi:GNAT superfamily N-acetyltransferase